LDPCSCSKCLEAVVDVAAGLAEMQMGRVDLAIARLRRLVRRHQLVGLGGEDEAGGDE
jgi:hypothetical protein